MDRVYLQWNLPNWITVFLMVGIGYTLLGLASQGVKQVKGS